MRVVRTALIFASGVGVYALMAACGGGGDDTGDSSPSGPGGATSSSTSTGRTSTGGGTSHQGGNGGTGGSGAGSVGGMGGMGASGGTTSVSGSGGGASSSTVGASSSSGTGGGMIGLRLVPEYEAGTDGTRDAILLNVQWSYQENTALYFQGTYYRPERAFFDLLRQEECVYDVGGDGKSRCLPTDVSQTPAVFSDAACTQRAVALPAAPPGCSIQVPKYALNVDPAPPTCSFTGALPKHVFPITGTFLGSNLACYGKNGASCEPVDCQAGSQGHALYTAGAEVPASAFVSATLQHD
jgi:hypothetical protein